MTRRPTPVTDADVALLRSLSRERSVVEASRAIGMTRDRATYRLARLGRAFGGPVVRSLRGGRGHGGTRLTPLGDRILRGGFDSVEMLRARPAAPLAPANLVRGTYRRSPAPRVEVEGGPALTVAFAGEEGEPVAVALDPEAILLAPGRFPSSARNVWHGVVVRCRPGRRGRPGAVTVRVGAVRWRAAVTADAVRQLGLSEGAGVWLYVKATALRRVGARR